MPSIYGAIAVVGMIVAAAIHVFVVSTQPAALSGPITTAPHTGLLLLSPFLFVRLIRLMDVPLFPLTERGRRLFGGAPKVLRYLLIGVFVYFILWIPFTSSDHAPGIMSWQLLAFFSTGWFLGYGAFLAMAFTQLREKSGAPS